MIVIILKRFRVENGSFIRAAIPFPLTFVLKIILYVQNAAQSCTNSIGTSKHPRSKANTGDISIACACDENSKAPASKITQGRQACMYKLLSILCETQMEARMSFQTP